MIKIKNIKEIIESAIKQEIASFQLYRSGLKIAQSRSAKTLFRRLMSEEQKHKRVLETLDIEKLGENMKEMNLAERIMMVPLTELREVKKILEFGMKKEEEAFQRYNKLAEAAKDAGMKKLFLNLAREENNHKNSLHIELNKVVS